MLRSKLSIAFVAVAVFAAVSVFAEDDVDESDVIVLGEDNFDDVVNKAELILVEFYAPWCGHCKKLTPEYAKAATALKADGVQLAKVDATEHGALAGRFGVRGYPTLKIFRNGNVADYSGPRDADGITKYMQKQVGPSIKPLESAAAVEEFISNEAEPSIVYFLTAKGSNYQTYRAFADKYREQFRFAETLDADALAAYGYSDNVLVIFRASRYVSKLDEPRVELQGAFSAAELEDFVFGKSLPLVSELTGDNNKVFFHDDDAAVLIAFYNVDYRRDPKGTNYVANRIRKAAKAFPDTKLRFAIANKDDFASELEKFGMKDREIGVAIDVPSIKGRYRLDDPEFSVDNVKELITQWTAGNLESYIKSEPVPEQKPGVQVVVGRNFDEIVMDEDKAIFLEMYAPWCGHCKRLEGTWNALGDKFKDATNVVIAKMDATANDATHPAYSARGYPTLMFAAPGAKERPRKYDGERDLDALVQFVEDSVPGGVKYASGGKKRKKKRST